MFDRASTLGQTLASPTGRAVLESFVPGIAESALARTNPGVRLGVWAVIAPAIRNDPSGAQRLWGELAALDDGPVRAPYAPAIEPRADYEAATVERGSAMVTMPTDATVWAMAEISMDGPSHGNPFVDVELDAEFATPEGTVRVGGFYDGDGRYLLRVLPSAAGTWSFTTRSTARSLDGLRGSFEVAPARDGDHGPVRADGFHFRHADGTRHRPIGTTAYAWTHQPPERQDETLATLAGTGFRKIRMCIFPKGYLYNAEEPTDFPFPGSLEDGFDLERFDPAHFRNLERRIEQLGDLGIQADVILFHSYDRWGFVDLGPAVDDRYLRYVVRRLAAYPHVWWSMANEYDLVWSKEESDWERLAGIVGAEDHVGHLNSIHNCRPYYDYSRPWITHVSIQRTDAYRTAENTDEWRERWGKPVVVDECAYEGDIDLGWGNIPGHEMVRRFWEGAMRGGYVGHGETYLRSDEVMWWAKGGVLHGTSPERIAFLDRIIADAPDGVLDPLPSEWDVPWGGVPGEYLVGYFGFGQPRFRNVVLPEGGFAVDVIDTWNMTVQAVPGVARGSVRVELPGRQFMAVRLRRVD
jgi:hypothetical protein